jgi:outer membrane protein insertion porin family
MKFKLLLSLITIFLLNFNIANSEILEKIEVSGNERVNSETIKLFANIKLGDDLSDDNLNKILKNLYDTGFFKDINIQFLNNTLILNVVENPIITNINISGINNKNFESSLKDQIQIKEGNSFNKFLINIEENRISNILKKSGFYLSTVETFVKEKEDNSIDLTFEINLGNKSYINKISFIGDKKFKSNTLRNVIVSEESKFWKFLSNKKFLDKERINLDKRLLINFYKNNGYYEANINSETIEYDKQNGFHLIFDITSGEKFYFDDFKINYPDNYDVNYFDKINNNLNDYSNKLYSFKIIEKMIKTIENIASTENYEFINVDIDERVTSDNKIAITLNINESDKFYVNRINISGNNVTIEDVIRNELSIDEGDPLNNILFQKSISKLRALNIFKNVNTEIADTNDPVLKDININIEEKPTGEITLGAGIGTSGASTIFGVKENNFLGRGIKLNTDVTLSKETIKGQFNVINTNYKNSDRDLIFGLQSLETDRLKNFGYKTNKTGLLVGTNFEYLNDLYFAPQLSLSDEKIETSSDASNLLKKQEGSYLDLNALYSFTFDKRDQTFQPKSGFVSQFSQRLPVNYGDNQTIINTYEFTNFYEYLDNKVFKWSIYTGAANTLGDKDVRISDRLNIPSSKLRGFESGKVGPIDNGDYVGGNYVTTLNISNEIPIFDNLDNMSFSTFYDAANVWGVDYNSSLSDNSKIRSSVGISANWYTPVGPLNFSFAQPITKASSDKTEGFRFNLGTSF